MDIKCDYRYWFDTYVCYVGSTSILVAGTEINAINGEHLKGENNETVESIIFEDCANLHYFPRALHLIFPNLESITITNSRLKEITREDLHGLEKVEELRLSNNQVRNLI